MAVVCRQEVSLAYFTAQCRGIKFAEVEAECGSDVSLIRIPSHKHDKNCVELRLLSGLKLGNLASEVARWLCPLLPGPFQVSG